MRCQLQIRVPNQSTSHCECALFQSEFGVSFPSKDTRTTGQGLALSYNIRDSLSAKMCLSATEQDNPCLCSFRNGWLHEDDENKGMVTK